MEYYLSSQLPSEAAVGRQLDEFLGARTAMQKVLKKEQDYRKGNMKARVKRQRLENLKEQHCNKKVAAIAVERL